MTSEPKRRRRTPQPASAQRREPVRLAALGDETIGSGAVACHEGGVLQSHVPQGQLTAWLPVLAPWLVLPEAARTSRPGANSVQIASELDALLANGWPGDRAGSVDAVLISAGLHDCFAMMTGTAPPPAETVASFEAMAVKLLDRRMTPIFVVPPPCAEFANGLFADRYIAIAATLRRLARQDGRIGLIDATRALVAKRAYGIEPDRLFSTGEPAGALTAHGAFRFARAAADTLRTQAERLFPGRSTIAIDESAEVTLNPNATLAGTGGGLAGEGVSGVCADQFVVQAQGAPGLTVTAGKIGTRAGKPGQSLRFGGRCSSRWGFVKLAQTIAPENLAGLGPGDLLQARCAFSLQGPVENIAALTLQLTPVWAASYAGLASGRYDGGPGVPEPHSGVLTTPAFAIPAPLTRLGVSLTVHVRPGDDLDVSGLLDVTRIVIGKATPQP